MVKLYAKLDQMNYNVRLVYLMDPWFTKKRLMQ